MKSIRGKPSVFLSYGREDLPSARKLYRQLTLYGVDVWFDEGKLLPGQSWEIEIEKAIRKSRYFIVLLSNRSMNRKGFLNREIRRAISILEEYPVSDVYLVPVRLEPCEPVFPALQSLQWLDIFEDWDDGLKKLLNVLGLEFSSIRSRKYDALLQEIDLCPRCGNKALTFEYRMRSGDNSLWLSCDLCKWMYESPKDKIEIDQTEFEEIERKHGPLQIVDLNVKGTVPLWKRPRGDAFQPKNSWGGPYGFLKD